jgi:hypothetical protein
MLRIQAANKVKVSFKPSVPLLPEELQYLKLPGVAMGE